MPILLLLIVLADLIAIASPLIAYFLYREWLRFNGTGNDNYADTCLYGAVALLLLALLGRFLVRAVLSKKRKAEDEPGLYKAEKTDRIKRPDGSVIHVDYYGKEDAPAIVFVHGLNSNNKNWYYQRKYFEKNYRLIMMDLPGMGQSTRPLNKDYSLTNLAGHLQAVIEHSGAKNPILWGHSMGGMVILTFLAKNKDVNKPSVKGAILQHTTYTNPVKTMIFSKLMTAIQRPVLTPLCWLMIALSPLLWLIRWMSYLNGGAHIMTRFLMFAGTQTPKQLEHATLLSTLTPTAVMARGCLGMFRYDVTKDLPNITLPVLILAANKDRLTLPRGSEYMDAHLPNSKLVRVTPGGHQALMERHSEVNEAAAQFIQSQHSG